MCKDRNAGHKDSQSSAREKPLRNFVLFALLAVIKRFRNKTQLTDYPINQLPNNFFSV